MIAETNAFSGKGEISIGSPFVVMQTDSITLGGAGSKQSVGIIDVVGFDVGEEVGDLVGDFVGEAVGSFVGATVGDAVGVFVGARVGETVGVFVGEAVGVFEGDKLGCALTVGVSVGFELG